MYNLEILEDWIFYYKNCLTEPYKYINFLEELNNNEKSYNTITKWENLFSTEDKNIICGNQKNIQLLNLTDDESLNKRIAYINNSISSAFYMCSNNYFLHFPSDQFKLNIDNKFVINKYFTNLSVSPNIDFYEKNNEYAFTILMYLNDDYIDGEMQFLNQKIKIKPEAGSIIIFPSINKYKYEFLPAHEKEKYVVMGKFYVKSS